MPRRRSNSGGGSGVGALIFLGLAAGVTVFSASREARAERAPPSPNRGRGGRFTPPTPTPDLSTVPNRHWWSPPASPTSAITRFTAVLHFDPLVERWRPEVTRRAGDLPVDGILQWIQIESGGNMCATGSPRERDLPAQLPRRRQVRRDHGGPAVDLPAQ